MTALQARDEIMKNRQILRHVQELIEKMHECKLLAGDAIVLRTVYQAEQTARDRIRYLEGLFKKDGERNQAPR